MENPNKSVGCNNSAGRNFGEYLFNKSIGGTIFVVLVYSRAFLTHLVPRFWNKESSNDCLDF